MKQFKAQQQANDKFIFNGSELPCPVKHNKNLPRISLVMDGHLENFYFKSKEDQNIIWKELIKPLISARNKE